MGGGAERLAENRNERRLGTRSAYPSLLAGLVYDEQGDRLIPTHASKDHRRYRYYVSQFLQIDGAGDGLRVAASDLEGVVTGRLLAFFWQLSGLFAAISGRVSDAHAQQQMLERGAGLTEAWARQSAAKQRALLTRIVKRILVRPSAVDLHLHPAGRLELLGSGTAPEEHPDDAPIVRTTAVQLTRWKKEAGC